MLSLWLTYMAGPTSNFRYIFPIIVLYPVLILFIFENDKKEELDNKESNKSTKSKENQQSQDVKRNKKLKKTEKSEKILEA